MTTRRFLVLGIGHAQVDLLRHLQGRCELHALSNSRHGRGFPLVDRFAEIDITDQQAVLSYARANHIDQIYTVGSDVAMPTVAHVASEMGLSSLVAPSVAATCNHKVAMRTALKEVYGAVPFELVAGPGADVTLGWPVVVKPVDSQGQRGVSMIGDPQVFDAAVVAAITHSRAGQAIVEPLIDGPEISVNAYLRDGELIFFLPSARVSWPDFDGGIIHQHLLPASLTDAEVARVRRLVVETLNTLGLRQGPAYFQIKMSGGHPWLIEVTPRLDGCHMWRLIEAATGVNLLSMAVSHLLGHAPDEVQAFTTRLARLEFFCQPPDTLVHHVEPHPSAVHVEWYYEPGERVRRMNGKMEKCGYQIILEGTP